jgi:hypothetical protein
MHGGGLVPTAPNTWLVCISTNIGPQKGVLSINLITPVALFEPVFNASALLIKLIEFCHFHFNF